MKRYYKDEKMYWKGHYNYYIFEDNNNIGVCYVDGSKSCLVERGKNYRVLIEITEKEFTEEVMLEML